MRILQIAVLIVLVLFPVSCGGDDTNGFSPAVYTEPEKPSEGERPLLGTLSAARVGWIGFGDDATAYIVVASAQWAELINRSGFGSRELIETGDGRMMFISTDSVKPLLGETVDTLVRSRLGDVYGDTNLDDFVGITVDTSLP